MPASGPVGVGGSAPGGGACLWFGGGCLLLRGMPASGPGGCLPLVRGGLPLVLGGEGVSQQ